MNIGEYQEQERGGLTTLKRWAEPVKVALAVVGACIAVGIAAHQITVNTLALESHRKVTEEQNRAIQENRENILLLRGQLDVLNTKLDELLRRVNELQQRK
jgi:hypothetical protein